ncbi:PAS domain S-box-containing protein [Halanaerobium saccharolyticum]|uniref:PAS domain S-box-containing protein n=1 Tax=Halanaerobium saccharolyticum TaxID=43595 RepID=A0A4R7YZS7_9FIRM|nr:[Fe-Fe] hydrogenase large subunit C-terminal domain-containing protein [Halanaerobium saccharolyticum]RAK07112.1 PAS domain S-box-containing protein [Halanaerobium saccharolyticum]TDW01876.1 PAS domain S-box-containing protein [Halanaerobium saccharolyticum]TDX53122.1 PAS domain S-box-containing protein [Halanaerobium saccharolyticum]
MNDTLIVKPASCKDCHKCLRECPVAAIGFKDSQAFIIEEKCIYCGNCIKTCPQGAKSALFEEKKLEAFLESDSYLIASIAPSFVTAFPDLKPGQLIQALKIIGFDYIAETAEAATRVVKQFKKEREKMDSTLITSCCPAVVNLIEKHYPEVLPQLAPVLSPMMLQTAELKNNFDCARVIFIGPCLAKIEESKNEKRRDYRPDIVITFEHLRIFLEEQGIKISELDSADVDLPATHLTADYALSGGAVKAADLLKADPGCGNKALHLSGLENIINFLEDFKRDKDKIDVEMVELLACSGGCINGPAINNDLSIPLKELEVHNYLSTSKRNNYKKTPSLENERSINEISVRRKHKNKKISLPEVPESEIKKILTSIAKENKEDEKDCGGCGYSSCREKAAAVFYGFAEKKMCIPYMKSRAESLSQIIVESSHNAIIVVNDQMKIQKFNPVAKELFTQKSRELQGMKLDKFMDSSSFQKAWNLNQRLIHQKCSYKNGSITVDQTIFALREHKVIVGILTDISEQEKQRRKMQKMKEVAVEKTNDVVNKQVQTVQEIAGLLGETTVETKAALTELSELLQAGDD